MKPREEGGVVDSKLNVYGVEGLKVADLAARMRASALAACDDERGS